MKNTWLVDNRWARPIVVLALFAMLAVAFLATSRPAAAQTPLPCYTTHIVQRGQYISQIARLYNVTPQAILAANPQISNPNLIYPGQSLLIPLCGTPTPPPVVPVPPIYPGPGTGGVPGTCRWHHYVLPGQTMLSISRQYGVNVFDIAEANGIFNLNLIYAGTTLCIP